MAECAPDAAALLQGSGARSVYRARWPAVENVIRVMVAGANLNENDGDDTSAVPHRLRQRQFAEAEAHVGATQRQLERVTEQIVHTQTCLAERSEALTAQHERPLTPPRRAAAGLPAAGHQ